MLSEIAARLPGWVDIVIIWIGLWGLMLWLFGRKLVKLTFVAIGLAGGALGAGVLMNQVSSGMNVLAVSLVGGIVGAVASWFLFRLWMALTLATLAALLAPWCLVGWQGTPISQAPLALNDTASQLVDQQVNGQLNQQLGQLSASAGLDLGNLGSLSGSEADGSTSATDEAEGSSVGQVLRDAVAQQRSLWGEWWASLSGTVRATILIVSALAAFSGLIIGLIMPNLSASAVSALVGSLAVLLSAAHLARGYAPEASAFIPSSPRSLLIAVLATTLVGTAIQWTISRRSTDK